MTTTRRPRRRFTKLWHLNEQRPHRVSSSASLLCTDRPIESSATFAPVLTSCSYYASHHKMSSQGRVAATACSSTSLLDWFKPLRNEAIARLRTNAVGLLGIGVLSNLLPIPTPWRAFDVVWQGRPASAPYYYLCAAGEWVWSCSSFMSTESRDAELLVLGVLAFNVLQASYALKFPRAPIPPPPTPTKSIIGTPLSPPARQWRLQGLTPTVRGCFWCVNS